MYHVKLFIRWYKILVRINKYRSHGNLKKFLSVISTFDNFFILFYCVSKRTTYYVVSEIYKHKNFYSLYYGLLLNSIVKILIYKKNEKTKIVIKIFFLLMI